MIINLNTFLTLFAAIITSATALSSSPSRFYSSSSSSYQTRYNFLSSSLATFLTSAVVVATPDSSCAADDNNDSKLTPTSPNRYSSYSRKTIKSNPRYLEYDLEMKYGDGPDGNPRTRGIFVRRYTGDATPYKFTPIRPVRLVKDWPESPPFKKEDFFRADEQPDKSFYTVPRLVYHIDEPAVASLTQYYRREIKPKSDVLDICSSWVSHYPLEFSETMGRISGTGMNALELKANDQLTDYVARNLNEEPVLPYEDGSFDVVTCVVSIDYLIHPVEVLKEVRRVLRPGGKVIISQSNRCFPSKAIAMWLRMNDRQHLELINGYLQYAGGFMPRKAFDITASGPGDINYNPMFIVEAIKEK